MLFRFCYHPETGSAPIREKMEGRNDRWKELYYLLGFGDEKVPLGAAVADVFDCGHAGVPGRFIADLVHRVGENGEAFVARSGKSSLVSRAVSTVKCV